MIVDEDSAEKARAWMAYLVDKAVAAAQEARQARQASTLMEEAVMALEDAKKALTIAKRKADEALALSTRAKVAAKASEEVEAIAKASPVKDFVTPSPNPASSVGSSVSGFQIAFYDTSSNFGTPQGQLVRKRKAVDADVSSADGPANSAVDLYLEIICANVRSFYHLKRVTGNAAADKAVELLSKQWSLIFAAKDLIVSPNPSEAALEMVRQISGCCDHILVLVRHLPPPVPHLVKQQANLIHELRCASCRGGAVQQGRRGKDAVSKCSQDIMHLSNGVLLQFCN